MDQLVFQHLQNHIENTMSMGEDCANNLSDAAEIFTQALLSGQTIYSCGHGVTSPLSQLFVHYLTSGYQIERPGFPALADLTPCRFDKFAAGLHLGHSQSARPSPHFHEPVLVGK